METRTSALDNKKKRISEIKYLEKNTRIIIHSESFREDQISAINPKLEKVHP